MPGGGWEFFSSPPPLRPTQPHIEWLPWALFLGVKRPGSEADHSLPSSAELKECVKLYLHSANTPSWRGAQLIAIMRKQGLMHECDSSAAAYYISIIFFFKHILSACDILYYFVALFLLPTQFRAVTILYLWG
jgi:hypothetical protein